MSQIDYKNKYLELKQKYKNSVDVAFRLGFEQGAQHAQMQSLQQQQEQQAQIAQQPQQAQEQPQEQPVEKEQSPTGSELDQHLQELSSLLGKSEYTSDDIANIQGLLGSIKLNIDTKKLVPMAKSIGAQASHNLPDMSKKAVDLQSKIVEDVMNAWAQEESGVKTGIEAILAQEGIKKV